MRKLPLILAIFSLLNLHAQEETATLPSVQTDLASSQPGDEAELEEMDPALQDEGDGTPYAQEAQELPPEATYVAPKAPSPKTNQAASLTNWIFAGSALVTAAIGVIAVALNPGSPAPDSDRAN